MPCKVIVAAQQRKSGTFRESEIVKVFLESHGKALLCCTVSFVNDELITYMGLASCASAESINFKYGILFKLKFTEMEEALCPFVGFRTVKQTDITFPASTLHPNPSSRAEVAGIHEPKTCSIDCDDKMDRFSAGELNCCSARGRPLKRAIALENAEIVITVAVGRGTLAWRVTQITLLEHGYAELWLILL